MSTPPHPTHPGAVTYSEFSERSPWKASGAISEIWLLLRSLKPKGRRWPGPISSHPMPPSSLWVQKTTPSTRYIELGVSETPSQCCHVGHMSQQVSRSCHWHWGLQAHSSGQRGEGHWDLG